MHAAIGSRCLGVLAQTITGASVYIPGPGDPTIEAGIKAAMGDDAPIAGGSDDAGAAVLPTRVARIVPAQYSQATRLGPATTADVFVVDAADIAGISSSAELSQRLTLLDAAGNPIRGPFAVIEFDTP